MFEVQFHVGRCERNTTRLHMAKAQQWQQGDGGQAPVAAGRTTKRSDVPKSATKVALYERCQHLVRMGKLFPLQTTLETVVVVLLRQQHVESSDTSTGYKNQPVS
eukprot:scpid101676/ scgid13462/ 